MATTSYIHLRHGFGGCTSAAYGRPYRLPSTVYSPPSNVHHPTSPYRYCRRRSIRAAVLGWVENRLERPCMLNMFVNIR